MAEHRIAPKRRREEWETLVDLVAADVSTDTSTIIPKGNQYDFATVLPRAVSSELREHLRSSASLLDALRCSVFQPQVSIEEGFHAKPIPIRITDLFANNIGSGNVGIPQDGNSHRVASLDTKDAAANGKPLDRNTPRNGSSGVDKAATFLERKAVDIASTVHAIVQRIPKQIENLRTEDLPMGSVNRLTSGFRRQRLLDQRYPKPDFVPVIFVPSAASAPIQLFNVREFLEEGVYVHPTKSYMSSINGGTTREEARPENVIVTPGAFFSADSLKTCAFRKFRVVDDPRQVDDWNHVCACIVTGVDWQFAEWFPGKGSDMRSPSLLFDFMRGFLAYFEEDRVPPAVQQWKVHPLVLTRKYVKTNAHIAQAFSFWEELYKFISVNSRFAHYMPPGDE